jgi:hypothetical protein
MKITCQSLRLLYWMLLIAGAGYYLKAAETDHCAICGLELSAKFYLIPDKLTEEKKRVCEPCSQLTSSCFVCGLPVKTNFTELSDGRFLCARDGQTAVLDDQVAEHLVVQVKDALDRMFSRFVAFPETNVSTAVIDRIHLQTLFKFPGHDYNCPNVLGYIQSHTNHGHIRYVISLLSGLPEAQLKAVIAHEYSHAWVFENVSARRQKALDPDAHEGFCELIAYLLMEAQGETEQKELLLRNHYTRGQLDLFIEAERRFGFNEVVDWMKYGADALVSKDDLYRIRILDVPEPEPARALAGKSSAPSRPVAPAHLALKGIIWVKGSPLALINDQTFAAQEQHNVRLGDTKELIRCLGITQDAVRVLIVRSGKMQELALPDR